MSNLSLPRVNFRGGFSTNVSTANNGSLVDAVKVAVNTQGKSDADFTTWIKQLDSSSSLPSEWNLFGDHSCVFVGATIHSVQVSGNAPTTSASSDPLIGAAVSLNGAVMVDLDPKGSLATQIFCDEIQVTGAGGLSIVGQPTRFCSRWVAQRNLTAGGFSSFAAVWHAVIPPDQLTISGTGSPAVDTLRTAQSAHLGLFIRFCTYLLAPQLTEAQLAANFASGQATENPAIGRVLGAIATWTPGEMNSLPTGRRLGTGSQIPASPNSFTANPAVFEVDRARQVVSLDLINAFPEVDTTLKKVDVGTVGLFVRDGTNTTSVPQRIGTVAYDQATYENGGGMVDVPYPAALDSILDKGTLFLALDADGTNVLVESDVTVETDDRAVYLQEEEERDIVLRILEKGAPASGVTSVPFLQLVTSGDSATEATPDTAVVQITEPAGSSVPTAPGSITLHLKALRAGFCRIVFGEPAGTPVDGLYFTNIRVLPADNYDHVTDADLKFPLIYSEVLRYYHLIHPKMSQIFDLSSEFKVRLRAQPIVERIDKSTWDRWAYMPRTRDMSDGKRKLLTRWVGTILGAGGGPTPGP